MFAVIPDGARPVVIPDGPKGRSGIQGDKRKQFWIPGSLATLAPRNDKIAASLPPYTRIIFISIPLLTEGRF